MISLIESGNLANTENNPMIPRSAELVGLSTDTKPTGMTVGNGWSFIEMDTGKVFFYNAEDEEWLEFAGSGGGGGQGGADNMVVANIDPTTMALDKTWAEIHAADAAVLVSNYGAKVRAYVITTVNAQSTCSVIAITLSGSTTSIITFTADAEDGYPVLHQG